MGIHKRVKVRGPKERLFHLSNRWILLTFHCRLENHQWNFGPPVSLHFALFFSISSVLQFCTVSASIPGLRRNLAEYGKLRYMVTVMKLNRIDTYIFIQWSRRMDSGTWWYLYWLLGISIHGRSRLLSVPFMCSSPFAAIVKQFVSKQCRCRHGIFQNQIGLTTKAIFAVPRGPFPFRSIPFLEAGFRVILISSKKHAAPQTEKLWSPFGTSKEEVQAYWPTLFMLEVVFANSRIENLWWKQMVPSQGW